MAELETDRPRRVRLGHDERRLLILASARQQFTDGSEPVPVVDLHHEPEWVDAAGGTAIFEVTGARHHRCFPDCNVPGVLPA